MEVTRHNFNASLPRLLEAIANATFVAIDLELSGIPGQQPNKSRRDGQGSNGLPTLQERYTDMKQAAEKYQVLQLGITCARAEHSKGKYVLEPYNFFLNPLPDSRLDIERTITYQSGAVEFLLNHRFRMEAPYLGGVPYLSRDEEAIARRLRQARSAIPDIEIKETDVEAIKFIETLKAVISAWRDGRELRPTDYLNIPPPDSANSHLSDRGLNGFQRRLVHQFVRTFYPDLVTVSRQGFVQILPYDQEREDANQARKDRAFEQNLEAQIGLRWPVEAMAGGDLTGLTPNSFLTYVDGREEEVAQHVTHVKEVLGTKRTVLVGHNVFMDLVYFYRCFFGKLPESVEDFQEIMHRLFPMIIDTKFLATDSVDNPTLAKSSLEDLNDQLSGQESPIIETHENFVKYANDKPAHEAGYDSLLTAQVLIRLSTKIEAQGHYIKNPACYSDDSRFTHPIEVAPPAVDAVPVVGGDASSSLSTDTETQPEDGGVSIHKNAASDLSSKWIGNRLARHERNKAKKPSKFSHIGRYDILEDLDSDFQEMSIYGGQGPTNSSDLAQRELIMMPPFDSPNRHFWVDSHFWLIYGNRLRVNGTVEGVCVLSEPYSNGKGDRGTS